MLKKIDGIVNNTVHIITGCLRLTRLDNLYPLINTVLHDKRWNVAVVIPRGQSSRIYLINLQQPHDEGREQVFLLQKPRCQRARSHSRMREL